MRTTGLIRAGRPFSSASTRQQRHRQGHHGRAAAGRGVGVPPPPAAATSGSGGGGSSKFGWASWALIPTAAAALLGGVSKALASSQQSELEAAHARAQSSLAAAAHWITALEQQPGVVKAFDAAMLLEADHEILEDDHMFSAFVSKGIVNDMTGYYDTQGRRFLGIISLGRDVCGFPGVVHGGLTAAIIDECFGGLLFALKKAKALPFWGPAYTVQLEVSYKAKVSAGRTVLCTTEVESSEGRKLWMKATVSDGPEGQVYATARALFVAPKPHKMVQDVGKYLFRRAFGGR
ncbi:hypothetical protein D9Q98_001135 [Chlorella vulgaris]|uniref:Thioesterase domain-containing protein n=1 Tax=Chlorella vulgaris TaxID=3077 RepID=A0A9D4Z2B4_CHLVU|nr:hypothetical protein D9Q98_001135 [Chlorella vulgaris]